MLLFVFCIKFWDQIPCNATYLQRNFCTYCGWPVEDNYPVGALCLALLLFPIGIIPCCLLKVVFSQIIIYHICCRWWWYADILWSCPNSLPWSLTTDQTLAVICWWCWYADMLMRMMLLMVNVMLQQCRKDNASSVTEAASEQEQHFHLKINSADF